MSKFVVLTDSTCDLPDELAKQHDIDILCFKIALDGEGYTERVDFTPEQFCQMLRNATGLPTTAQITQFEYLHQRGRQRHQRGGACGGGAIPRGAPGKPHGDLHRG